jgi:hypothetical protein
MQNDNGRTEILKITLGKNDIIKVKESRNRPGVAQSVPRLPDFMTFGT